MDTEKTFEGEDPTTMIDAEELKAEQAAEEEE